MLHCVKLKWKLYLYSLAKNLNRTLDHLLQPNQGLLNEPRSGTVQKAQFKRPSLGTHLENNRTTYYSIM